MSDRRLVFFLSDPLPDDFDPVAELGGKGAGLQRLLAAGFSTPPGFTVVAAASRSYLEQGRWPPGLEEELAQNLQRLEKSTGRKLGVGPEPLLLAVRSGAAVSMPGMLDTVLNCGQADSRATTGVKPWRQLIDAVTAVFESWNSDRARAWRQRRGIDDGLGTAVTVQAMFPAEFAGVVFTRDPHDQASSYLVVESAAGLGEGLVSGNVHPTRFQIDRQDPTQVQSAADGKDRKPIGDMAPPLPALTELARTALTVEQHFGGTPSDIEWGWAAGELALLQYRPMKTSSREVDPDLYRRQEIERLQQRGATGTRWWSLYNLDETLPYPTPLTWDLLRALMQGGFARLYRRLGYRPAPGIAQAGFLELIGGRIYADPLRQATLFWDGLPLRYADPDISDARDPLGGPPTEFDADAADSRLLLSLPANLWSMFRVARKIPRLKQTAAAAYENTKRPAFLTYVEEERRQDLTLLSHGQLLDLLRARQRRILEEFGPAALLLSFLAAHAFAALRALLVQLGGPQEGSTLAADLVGGLKGGGELAQHQAWEQMRAGELTPDEFLSRFGHRGPQEMELAEPRWAEMPEQLAAVVVARQDVTARARLSAVARREQAEQQLPARLAAWGGSSFQERVDAHRRQALALLPYRESAKDDLLQGWPLLREAAREIGRRGKVGDGVFYLQCDELPLLESDPAAAAEKIAQRRTQRDAFRRFSWPALIDTRRLEQLDRPPAPTSAACYQGDSLAGGVAEGVVLVAHDPQASFANGPTDGYILVCRSTDPQWTPLLLHAVGLAVENGGQLSHGAIIARELGLPAVAFPGILQHLTPGMRVRIDGNRGCIWRTDAE
ncbi:PEP/pyruvate-binding domain-containing protein [Lignipirellula cremea]|uniref:Phosphoenolpyruvate synthase n=1 Tax=Lignipirellula cremea TaxID=2528010 RepID=A0A518DPT3_9BACT|nr:PEP/pyruvate-binding domain-containing protein [Lignipirellula cremea]QDU93847.1 Phosphoenolpyruvate synthase [Lignipirellula cremea]